MFSIFIRSRSCVIHCLDYNTGFEIEFFRAILQAIAFYFFPFAPGAT